MRRAACAHCPAVGTKNNDSGNAPTMVDCDDQKSEDEDRTGKGANTDADAEEGAAESAWHHPCDGRPQGLDHSPRRHRLLGPRERQACHGHPQEHPPQGNHVVLQPPACLRRCVVGTAPLTFSMQRFGFSVDEEEEGP